MGWFLSVAQVKSAIAVGQGAMNDLRLAVFEHIQRLSLNYFDKTHQGRIISRADTDIDSLDRIMTWGANQLLASGLTLIGVITLLLQYDWRLCLAVSIVLPPLAIATRMFHIHGMQAYRKVREQSSRNHGGNGREYNRRACRAGIFSRGRESRPFPANPPGLQPACRGCGPRYFTPICPLLGSCPALGRLVILECGSTLVMHPEITVGELAAFVLALGMFFGPIQTMGDLYNAVLSTAASAERIFQLLDTEPQIKDRPGARPLPPVRGHVAFEHVWFRYDTTPADVWVLKDIHFEAKPGETVAFVGATGSGKTSIISLLARFYEPQQRSHHYRWS